MRAAGSDCGATFNLRMAVLNFVVVIEGGKIKYESGQGMFSRSREGSISFGLAFNKQKLTETSREISSTSCHNTPTSPELHINECRRLRLKASSSSGGPYSVAQRQLHRLCSAAVAFPLYQTAELRRLHSGATAMKSYVRTAFGTNLYQNAARSGGIRVGPEKLWTAGMTGHAEARMRRGARCLVLATYVQPTFHVLIVKDYLSRFCYRFESIRKTLVMATLLLVWGAVELLLILERKRSPPLSAPPHLHVQRAFSISPLDRLVD